MCACYEFIRKTFMITSFVDDYLVVEGVLLSWLSSRPFSLLMLSAHTMQQQSHSMCLFRDAAFAPSMNFRGVIFIRGTSQGITGPVRLMRRRRRNCMTTQVCHTLKNKWDRRRRNHRHVGDFRWRLPSCIQHPTLSIALHTRPDSVGWCRKHVHTKAIQIESGVPKWNLTFRLQRVLM